MMMHVFQLANSYIELTLVYYQNFCDGAERSIGIGTDGEVNAGVYFSSIGVFPVPRSQATIRHGFANQISANIRNFHLCVFYQTGDGNYASVALTHRIWISVHIAKSTFGISGITLVRNQALIGAEKDFARNRIYGYRQNIIR